MWKKISRHWNRDGTDTRQAKWRHYKKKSSTTSGGGGGGGGSSSSSFGHPTKHIIGHFGDDFYGSDDPANSVNSVKVLKDNSRSVHQVKGQSHLTKHKVKWRKYNLKKHLHSTIKSKDTEVLEDQSPIQYTNLKELLIMIVQRALLKCYTILGSSTETVLLIFPFLQTNVTVQMRPSGG